MLQYPINWKLTNICVDGIINGQYISELKLSNEWTLLCLWKIKTKIGLRPYILEIRRNSFSEETCIFGTLSVSCSGRAEPEQQFSKLLKSGSCSIGIDLEFPTSDLDYSLHGNVNIVSNSDKLANYFRSGDNQKCIRMMSLVQLSNDFELLLDPQEPWLSDVNLKCGSVSIPAHKIILSVRSPVFAAMFKTEMKERHENQVNITDVDAPVLRTMLAYIYTGKTSDLTISLASELFIAADKYQLSDLKSLCSDFLKDNINHDNVLRILVLGHLHAEELKLFVLNYICTALHQFSTLQNSAGWEALREQSPDLALEVLTFLVNARDQRCIHRNK